MGSQTIDKDVLRQLVADSRKDIKRGVVSTSDALFTLQVSKRTFESLKDDPNTKLKPSKMKGKWIWSSVVNEFERVHGEPYKEAVLQ
tara:strand:+ start:444 stop:704 length:261 start_codon:yes stop_codon:yes gene_type:complete